MTTNGRGTDRPLRILVDSGDYHCGNLGDLAMLQVSLKRLRELWPTASIEVVTQDAAALAVHCPGVKPVSWTGRQLWVLRGTLLGKLDRALRPISPSRSGGVERLLRRREPALLASLIRGKLRLRGGDSGELDSFLDSLNGADLMVLAGAGGFTDHAYKWAIPVLEVLALSVGRGIPTAVFSHGLGPLTDPELRHLVQRTLPRVGVVALREGLGALPLLDSLGVARDCVTVTGDDAIELAYDLRSGEPGTAIGLNVRVASSANVSADFIDVIKPRLHEFANERGSALVPLPIARSSSSRATPDSATIRALLAGYDDSSDGGESVDTPQQVVRDAGRCRVVVTGAYHAAVFALSQGIPVVALSNSAFYMAKFLGLSNQFTTGCTIVDLQGDDVPGRFGTALMSAWDSADSVRQPLLDAAARQIASSRAAYRRFGSIVGGSLS